MYAYFSFHFTLYFLNLYNTINPSKQVLEKMESIADEYQLKGYEYDDTEYFLLQYYKHFDKIMISLLAWFPKPSLI